VKQLNDAKEDRCKLEASKHQLQEEINRTISYHKEDVMQKVKEAFEHGKSIQADMDKGRLGENCVEDEIRKALPNAKKHGDRLVIVDGIKILQETKNAKLYNRVWVQNHLRDVGLRNVDAGLYVSLEETKKGDNFKMWELANNIPLVTIDGAKITLDLLLLVSRFLLSWCNKTANEMLKWTKLVEKLPR